MATKGTRVTEAEILKMVELYIELGSFKKVGKKMRRSPDTVSKYVHQWMAVHNCVNHFTKAGVQLQPTVKTQVKYTPVTQYYTPFFNN